MVHDTCGWRSSLTPGEFPRLGSARSANRRVDHCGDPVAHVSLRPPSISAAVPRCRSACSTGHDRRAPCSCGFRRGRSRPSRHCERAALVDVLRTLIEWQVLRTSGGSVDDFVETEDANALLQADTTRLHRLLVSTAAPTSGRRDQPGGGPGVPRAEPLRAAASKETGNWRRVTTRTVVGSAT